MGRARVASSLLERADGVAKEGEVAALLEELPAGEVDGRVETEMAEVAMEV